MAEITRIRLGWSDGMRFVGIKSPLSEDEVAALEAQRLTSHRSIEQIAGEQACSLVRRGGSNNDAVAELATQIGEVLVDSRGAIDIDVSRMVQMQGFESSPFEPVTNR